MVAKGRGDCFPSWDILGPKAYVFQGVLVVWLKNLRDNSTIRWTRKNDASNIIPHDFVHQQLQTPGAVPNGSHGPLVLFQGVSDFDSLRFFPSSWPQGAYPLFVNFR